MARIRVQSYSDPGEVVPTESQTISNQGFTCGHFLATSLHQFPLSEKGLPRYLVVEYRQEGPNLTAQAVLPKGSCPSLFFFFIIITSSPLSTLPLSVSCANT
jgi:hypothetical protein